MNRIELACYTLIATAFILAALLITQLQNRSVLPEARAEMNTWRDNITLTTAQTKRDEEAVFLIENNTSTLLIYKMDLGKKRLEPLAKLDLRKQFD